MMDLTFHAFKEREQIPMIHVMRQHLAAAFLFMIGLSASGCGDTATVSPEAALANLTVTIGTIPATLEPLFNPEPRDYTVKLSNNITTATITAQPAVAGDTVTIDDQTTTSRSIDLGQLVPTESTKLVRIVVSNPPSSSRTYTVSLKRAGLEGNNSLSSLTVSPGTLDAPFNINALTYKVDVANTVESVSITPTLSDPAAKMTVNGEAMISGQPRPITLNGPGQSTAIPIAVTAQNDSVKTYIVTVSRGISSNSNLRTLAVSPGSLDPEFDANELIYTVDVANTVGSVSVTPTRQDPTATITVDGQATNSGQARAVPLEPAGQSTPIPIVVTAQNGNSKTYFVNVNRGISGNKKLQNLVIIPGPLTPAFEANILPYTVDVANTVGSVSVTPTRQDPTATITVDGQDTNSGQARTITLKPAGEITAIQIVVTAQNGSQKTYIVNVTRAALGGNNNLSALTVSSGALDPEFNASTLSYTVNVGSTVANVTVSATKADSNAVISGDMPNEGQATIPLDGPGTTTSVLVNVTAPNGNSKTYRINVNRAFSGNKKLSALTVSPGSLAPTFNENDLSYTVSVDSGVSSVTVTATLQDTNATMTIEGQGTSSGQDRSISLGDAGTSTDIDILVTAPNGSQKTITITVNRAAPAPAPPAAPTTAPDLIPADDSCLRANPADPLDPDMCDPNSGTSRVDNKTNVTAPRFRIPQPAAGETANLYIDGNPVSETFDPVTNTLKPTAPSAPLSDGPHAISYTLNNAGGESPPSLSLPITINTVAP